MKKSFKGILALFLALALLCASIPVASAETNDYKGEVFQWDVSTNKLIEGDLSKADGYYDYFDVVASEDIVATIQLTFIDAFHAMNIDIWEDGTKLYSLESTKAVHLVMEAGKTYSFNLYYITGSQTHNYGAYSIEFTKKDDFTIPVSVDGTGYLWNGRGTQNFDKRFPYGVYDLITRYYVTTDTTFNLYFYVNGYLPEDHRNIVVSCPNGEYVVYDGSPLSTTITLEAGEYFYITLRSSSIVPSDFQYYITLAEI